MIQAAIKIGSTVVKSPTVKRYSQQAINTLAKRGKSIWGVSVSEIAQLTKKGIKVKEYYKSGSNPGQR